MKIDSIIVAGYFVIVFIAGYFVSRHYKKASAGDFITGGRDRTWYQVAFALFAMAADPAIISLCGLGFLWGFYIIQWNSVHMWFTAWFAAMFIVPIYWRSRIVTTPEYLEKRFSLPCRSLFSLLLMAALIITLSGAVYLGALLLENFLGWPLWSSMILISAIIGFYVILGGMKTVLTMDFYQGIFVIVTLVIVIVAVVNKVGGFAVLANSSIISKAGVSIHTIVPPSDWSLTTTKFFPTQAILAWAPITGLAWLSCNFSMAQRLLAAKSEQDAQKGLLAVAILAVFYPLASFVVGCLMRIKMPDILPDEAFIKAILVMVPVGLRGILIAGLMAALLSTVDGMLTASSALFTEDFYSRIIRKDATPTELKKVVRIAEILTILLTLALIPIIRKADSVMVFIQDFYAYVFGVTIAIYLIGMFTKKVAPRSGFIAMITSVALTIALDVFSDVNFAYIGVFSFIVTIVMFFSLSVFEKQPATAVDLENLTVHTLSDAKGPWVGLKAWPGLWKWALALAASWVVFSFCWEAFMRSLANS
ncbi:MAG: sodium/solute symporter [Kiritimatiellia bacterium]|jgi:SSS family solute:Na+ symporter|nr:sodium/solute symporter [Kiritimatiellia bacterium]